MLAKLTGVGDYFSFYILNPVTYFLYFVFQWYISQQLPQFEDVKFEAASILSELFCQQVSFINF